jgi:hypothetical protein
MVNAFNGSIETLFPFMVHAFDGLTGHCLLTVNAFNGTIRHYLH